MAEGTEPIKITSSDLTSQRVEEFVAQQQAGRQGMAVGALPPPTPFWLSPIFYLGLAGALGALSGWGIIEPFFDDGERTAGHLVAAMLFFPTIGGLIGLFIGAAEGIVSRNLAKGALGGVIGLGVGFAGGFLSAIVAGFVYGLIHIIGAISGLINPHEVQRVGLRGTAFLLQVMARSMAWAAAGVTVGLGQGIAMKSSKMVWTGLLGGTLGGAIGGLFFDPVNRILAGPMLDKYVEPSRAIGVMCVGLMAGMFVGLVEHFAKEAWLLMAAGPLAGKQFVLYKNPTTLGSSPKCDVYLFKDPEIEPRHAQIHKVGVHYELEDCGSAAGGYVNNIPIKRQRLQDGDRIVLGKTVFQYSERAKEKAGA